MATWRWTDVERNSEVTEEFRLTFHSTYHCSQKNKNAFQSNANHPLADSIGYIKLEGTWISSLTLM